MKLRDPEWHLRKVPVKAGAEWLYYVSGPGNLDAVLIEKSRIVWKEDGVTPTSFLRNRNLRRTPQACRGLLCVFLAEESYLPGETAMERKARFILESLERTKFRLGVVAYLQLTTCLTIYLYEWIGPVKSTNIEETPLFLYNMLNEKRDKEYFGNHNSHFRQVNIDFDVSKKRSDHHVIHFLNLVSTPKSLHEWFKSVPECINEVDGCYEMKQSGPDCLFHPESMPKPYQLHGTSLGQALLLESHWNISLLKRKRDHQYHWKNVPEWLRDPGRSLDSLPCHLYTFVNDSSSMLLSNMCRKIIDRHVAVPYVRTDSVYQEVCEFAYIPARTWRTMVKLRKSSIEDHNAFLDKNNVLPERQVFTVVTLDRGKRGGVKIALCTKDEFDGAKTSGKQWLDVAPVQGQHQHRLGSQCTFTGGNECCPGNILISFVKQQSVSSN